MLQTIKKSINNYDPYGMLQVNATQALAVALSLLFINASYKFPLFEEIMLLPFLGIIITGGIFGYYPRIKAFIVFSLFSILYTIIFCLINSYLTIILFTMALLVPLLFFLGRRYYAPLLSMVGVIQVCVFVFCQIPNSGNYDELTQIIVALLLVTLLGVGLMSLFPKVYFFRVWRRALYLTIHEFSETIYLFKIKQLNPQQLWFKHLVSLNSFTQGLHNDIYAFSARRVSLRLTKIYTALMPLFYHITQIETHELESIINLCKALCLAIEKNQTLHSWSTINSTNTHFLKLQCNFNYVIKSWNELCLKN